MLKEPPLYILICLSLTTLVLAQKCKKPSGTVGDVRYEGCNKYECVKASKKRGKWVGPTVATDICCNMTGSFLEPGTEIYMPSNDECYEVILRCENDDGEPSMTTEVINNCEPEGPEETVCSACWRVIYEDIDQFANHQGAVNVLTRSSVEINQTPGPANYWITPVDMAGSFVLDLGCSATYNYLELVNTHNAELRDRNTRGFRVLLGDTPDPDWVIVRQENKARPKYFLYWKSSYITQGILSLRYNWHFVQLQPVSGELPDTRTDPDPLPLHNFTFPPARGRYVKFEVLSWELVGGGLQYFNIMFREVELPIEASLTISGPGHDSVEQEMVLHPEYNETVISVPAHGENIEQEVVLQGIGGLQHFTVPMITYVREEACYVTNLPIPSPFDPSALTELPSVVHTEDSVHQYYVNGDFYQIMEGSSEYNGLSTSTKSRCVGKVIWKGNYVQLDQEAWEEKQQTDYFNLTDPDNFRLNLRPVEEEKEKDRQSNCSISQWYGCTSNTWNNGAVSSCWFWSLVAADGTITPIMHVHGIMEACLVCTRFCPENGVTAPPGFLCDCDQINSIQQFLSCYYSQWFSCPPGYQYCPGVVGSCYPSWGDCPS